MSQAELDSIIKRYEKNIFKSTNDILHTERKRESKDHLTVTFMDNNYTPTKQLRQPGLIVQNRGQMEEILKRLDDTESKFVISERNYADVYRKYQKLKHAYDLLSNDVQKERKTRLQQIIDTQNKLNLLQTDNQRNIIKLQSKQQTITILKQKLSEKQEQIVIFQQQLQEISRKLCETLELRSKQSINMLNRQLSINNQQASKTLDLYKEKYEKSVAKMKAQVERFNTDLLEKQKQKKKLLDDMQQLSKLHAAQLSQIKQVVSKNQEQYKNWLDQSKKEKIQIIQKYQQQIRELRKSQYIQKLAKSDNAIEQTTRGKMMIREMELKILDLQNQNKGYKSQIEKLSRVDKQASIKINSMQQQLKFIKGQYVHQVSENKKLLMNLKSEQERNQLIKKKNNNFQIQIQSLKSKLKDAISQKQKLQKQIQFLKQDKQKQLKSLIHIKKQLNQASNNQININSVLTQTSLKLQQKVRHLQEQLQSTTTQLYAERLEKAKIRQQLQQTKIQLKREYELSVQNTRKQLKQQIKQNVNCKSVQEIQKEEMYLKMFKLERDYQLLKCQVVTSEEMLKMGNKMYKYYQNYKRKTK